MSGLTKADLQKAFQSGYSVAKALYAVLSKGGYIVTEAEIKHIVTQVMNELTGGGDTIDPKYLPITGGYIGTTNVTILDPTELEFTDIGGMYGNMSIPLTTLPGNGTVVYAEYDGQKYECVVIESPDGFYFIGNASLVDNSDDTGEPFLVLCQGDQNAAVAATEGLHTLSLYYKSEAAIPTEMRFMPNEFFELMDRVAVLESNQVCPDCNDVGYFANYVCGMCGEPWDGSGDSCPHCGANMGSGQDGFKICETCGGKKLPDCPDCGGLGGVCGSINCDMENGEVNVKPGETCPMCGGSDILRCNTCNGLGKIIEVEF